MSLLPKAPGRCHSIVEVRREERALVTILKWGLTAAPNDRSRYTDGSSKPEGPIRYAMILGSDDHSTVGAVVSISKGLGHRVWRKEVAPLSDSSDGENDLVGGYTVRRGRVEYRERHPVPRILSRPVPLLDVGGAGPDSPVEHSRELLIRNRLGVGITQDVDLVFDSHG